MIVKYFITVPQHIKNRKRHLLNKRGKQFVNEKVIIDGLDYRAQFERSTTIKF